MLHFSADALVLRAVARDEHDKLLTLLTADYGRFYAVVKGAHSARRREIGSFEPYTFGNFELGGGGSVKWVRNATTLEAFGGLRYDPEKLFLAAYIADVAYDLSGEREPAHEMLSLTLNTLHRISEAKGSLGLIKAAFEMRAAAISGFCPELSGCGRCGAPVGDSICLDVMNGSFLCGDCLHRASLAYSREVDELGERNVLCPLDASAAAALAYVVRADAKRIFSFSLTDPVSVDLFCRAAEAYLLHHLERTFVTLENYKKMQITHSSVTKENTARGI
ncbi:MAG: DNA repair protein RecO [Ruminococcaceae bacterium]|nr:DNA repair protein RecO [Oscillospiraceae bacterium]